MNLSNIFKEVRKSDGTHNLTDIDKLEEAIKEFIKKRFEAIEQEQKTAKSMETKQALLLLKTKLEEEVG